MPRSPTEPEVRRIRAMRGQASAQDVGTLFDLGAETIRRIWRRETHRHVQDAAEPSPDLAGSLAVLGNLLNTEPPSAEEGSSDDPA